jgi:hypothetical protein
VARRPPRGFKSWSSYNRWRVERGEQLGLSRSQALGHPREGEPTAHDVLSEHRWVVTFPAAGPARLVTIDTDLRTAQRAGRFNALGRALREARITPEDYRRRARRYMPIAGFEPLSNPRALIALFVASTREEWVFESGRQRPRRTRIAQ